MKILSVVPYKVFPPRTGGQRAIALLERYLARQVELICITVKSNYSDGAGYPVLNLLADSPLRYINPFYFFTLRRIIRRQAITHLLLEHPYYGWLGILLQKTTGVKLVVRSHNIEATRWKQLGKWWWKLLYYYEQQVHRSADYSLFIQEADYRFAINRYGVPATRCIVTTYGLEWDAPFPEQEDRAIKAQIRQQHGIAAEDHLFLFNGAFNYGPNLDALNTLVERVNPLLQQKQGFRYKIIVCGMNIPESISSGHHPDMIIVGFADDISRYFRAADVFLNPVSDGGGIKTKLVEALGYNCNVVSTANGAIGVDPQWCNGKLWVVDNTDWQAFADAIPLAAGVRAGIPPLFFKRFYWGNIIHDMLSFIGGA